VEKDFFVTENMLRGKFFER